MSAANTDPLLNTARSLLLAELPDVWAIYVYGSYARAEQWPDSDLDLAVLLPPGNAVGDLYSLLGKLSQALGRDVDLVDLRKVGDVLRSEVLSDGCTLYVSNPDAVLSWEASAMSRYARHREEISGILEDFRRTGIGYGA